MNLKTVFRYEEEGAFGDKVYFDVIPDRYKLSPDREKYRAAVAFYIESGLMIYLYENGRYILEDTTGG